MIGSLNVHLPSPLADDLIASVWAASAFVRSNNNSWNLFVSFDAAKSAVLKTLEKEERKKFIIVNWNAFEDDCTHGRDQRRRNFWEEIVKLYCHAKDERSDLHNDPNANETSRLPALLSGIIQIGLWFYSRLQTWYMLPLIIQTLLETLNLLVVFILYCYYCIT